MFILTCHKCKKNIMPKDKFCPHCNAKVSKIHGICSKIGDKIGNSPLYLVLLALVSVLLLDLSYLLYVETGQKWALFVIIIMLLPIVPWMLKRVYKLAMPTDLGEKNILPVDNLCPQCNENISKFYMILNKTGNNHIYFALLILVSTILLSIAWFLRVDTGQTWIIYLGILLLMPLVPWILKYIYIFVAPADLATNNSLYIFCPHCNVKTSNLYNVLDIIGHSILYLTLAVFLATILLDIAWFLSMKTGQGWIVHLLIIMLALLVPWALKATYKLAAPGDLEEKTIEPINNYCPHCYGEVSKIYNICNKIGNNRLYFMAVALISTIMLSIFYFLQIETGQKWIIYLGIIMLITLVPSVLMKAYKSVAGINFDGKNMEQADKFCLHCNVKVNIFYNILHTLEKKRLSLMLLVLLSILLVDMLWFLGMQNGAIGIIYAIIIMLLPVSPWIIMTAHEIRANLRLDEKISSQFDKFRLQCKSKLDAVNETLDEIEKNRLYLILLVLTSILLLGTSWFLRMETGEKWIIYVVIFILVPFVPWILKVAYKIAAPLNEDEKKDEKSDEKKDGNDISEK